MQKPAIPPRMFAILARNSKRAVLLRRGPTKWCQLILWHTDTDEIIPGQWVHHRVYERTCDLSPDGQLFVYHAFTGRRNAVAGWAGFTAVSRPPYFTALATWTYHMPGGGGLFTSHRDLLVFSSFPVQMDPPLHPSAHPFTRDTFDERLRLSGWTCVTAAMQNNTETLWEKHHRRDKWTLVWHTRLPTFTTPRPHDAYHIRLSDDTTIPLESADWADIDQRQRLVFTRHGKLHAATVTQGKVRETLLADFTDNKPTPVPPPAWATRWPK